MRLYNTPRVIVKGGSGCFRKHNTVEGIVFAVSKGATGIEVDVHVSSDGVPFLHHDTAMEDGRKIMSTHSEEIPVTIPKLVDVIVTCCRDRIWLNVDLKFERRDDETEMAAHLRAMEAGRKVAKLLRETRMPEAFWSPAWMLSSFNSSVLAGAEQVVEPEGLILAKIMYKPMGNVPQNIVLPCDTPYRYAHAASRNVWVWGTPTQEEAASLFRAGVIGIITDHPELL